MEQDKPSALALAEKRLEAITPDDEAHETGDQGIRDRIERLKALDVLAVKVARFATRQAK